MYYLKHPQHGNRHVATAIEAEALKAQGWARWPRSKSEKNPKPAVVHETQPVEPKPYRPTLNLSKRK